MSLASCISAAFRRIGGMTASFGRTGRMSASAVRQEGVQVSCTLQRTGCACTSRRVGGMAASFGIVCSTSLGEYILWGRDGIIFNVYGDKIYLTRH